MTVDTIEKVKCNGCHACFNACPKKCIDMKADEEGFLYPAIDKNQCVDCGVCVKSCPVLSKEKTDNEPVAYAVQNKDELVRMNSSSGGFFTILAEKVIENDGYVFGAALDEKQKLSHICVENKKDLDKLRCSKYLQSEIGDSYKKAKELLDANEWVLFTGTPCQIAGLYKYLGKDYNNLLTHDIICHGVPSPMVWQKYVSCRENEAGAKIQNANFRNKNSGWKRFSMQLQFDNNTEYIKTVHEDLYMKAFLQNFCLRPSCYNCSFKDSIRQSDFTLADLWGAEKIIPEIDDDKGTSLVFVNSKKAKQLFDSLKNKVTAIPVDIEQAVMYNSAMIKSVDLPEERQKFMTLIKIKQFDYAIKKSIKKVPLYKRIVGKIKRVLKGIFSR